MVAPQRTVYQTAKFVLVGDSGVGKTGLAQRLVNHCFAETWSTHGHHVWSLSRQERLGPDGNREVREIYLWDPAGQPGYRTLNQIDLANAQGALLVFDESREDVGQFADVRYWVQALRRAEQQRDKVLPSSRKLLVSARCDRGYPGLSSRHIEEIVSELGLDGFLRTSAKDEQGIEELRDAISAAIAWDELPRVFVPAEFAGIRALVLDLKMSGDLFTTPRQLCERLDTNGSTTASNSDLALIKTCVTQLQMQGLVRLLNEDGLILLDPALFDIYAAELLQMAGKDPEGLGLLDEELAMQAPLQPLRTTKPHLRQPELLLRLSVIREFLALNLAIRIDTGERRYLLFPSAVQRDRPSRDQKEGVQVIYTFAGEATSVFATLVVQLSLGQTFARREIWRNAATFVSSTDTVCGFSVHELDPERSELRLFFERLTPNSERELFEQFVKTQLERLVVSESIVRRRVITCEHCGEVLSERIVVARRQRGDTFAHCPFCEHRISLLEENEEPGSPWVDVFLSYHQEDIAEVRAIAEAFVKNGVNVWFDDRERRIGESLQARLSVALTRTRTIAILIGRRGFSRWQAFEIEAFSKRLWDPDYPIIPVLLPGASDTLPPFLAYRAWVDCRQDLAAGITQLVQGIKEWRTAGIRILNDYSDAASSSLRTLGLTRAQEAAIEDARQIKLAASLRACPNPRSLAMAILRRLNISEPVSAHLPPFSEGSVWSGKLPPLGLRLSTPRVLVILRLFVKDRVGAEQLAEQMKQGRPALLIFVDLHEIPGTQSDLGATPTIQLTPRALIELVDVADGEVSGWLGRLITSQVDVGPMLPYRAEGVTASELFFGRDQELALLMGEGRRGGVILGVHQSGKSSLLGELSKRIGVERPGTMVKSITLTEGIEGFYEQTLDKLSNNIDAAKTPAAWAKQVRSFAKRQGRPVFLLDEVDWLVSFDAAWGHKLGSQIRALQQDGHADFYLAGHLELYRATLEYGSPFRNFAEVVALRGLSQPAALRLIREPVSRIGFEIGEAQALRIFEGTAGMASLIQEFCGRLILGLRGSECRTISDDTLRQTEETSGYLDKVFHYYYNYDDSPVSRAIFLLVGIAQKITRATIAEELKRHRVRISREQIDAVLSFLASFGILDQFSPGVYRMPGRYLQRAIDTREPNALLEEELRKLRRLGRSGK